MHLSGPSLVALALVVGCGSPAPRASTAPSPTSTRTGAADTPAADAPAAPPLCDAVGRIVDAGGRYDFPAVAGKWISDDPPMSELNVRVAGARECTLGIDDAAETSEVWCLMELPDDAEGQAARYAELRDALLPCFDDRWRSAADDRELPGWAFAPAEGDRETPYAEVRLEPGSRGTDLVFRVVSQPHAGEDD